MISLRYWCGCAALVVAATLAVVLLSGSPMTSPVLGSVVPESSAFVSNSEGRDFDSPEDEDDFYYRRDHGHYDVVWMNGLVQDFRDELISEEDFLAEVEAARPGLTAVLF